MYSGIGQIKYKTMTVYDDIIVFASDEYHGDSQLQGKIAIVKDNTKLAELIGDTGQRLGEYVWLGRVTKDDSNLILAVSRKQPTDTINIDHIDFYLLSPHQTLSQSASNYTLNTLKIDAI